MFPRSSTRLHEERKTRDTCVRNDSLLSISSQLYTQQVRGLCGTLSLLFIRSLHDIINNNNNNNNNNNSNINNNNYNNNNSNNSI